MKDLVEVKRQVMLESGKFATEIRETSDLVINSDVISDEDKSTVMRSLSESMAETLDLVIKVKEMETIEEVESTYKDFEENEEVKIDYIDKIINNGFKKYSGNKKVSDLDKIKSEMLEGMKEIGGKIVEAAERVQSCNLSLETKNVMLKSLIHSMEELKKLSLTVRDLPTIRKVLKACDDFDQEEKIRMKHLGEIIDNEDK